jgi:aspartyl-tRNA(Asn)/glutamyl-tRNA(Gln) amidotransferase subunit A
MHRRHALAAILAAPLAGIRAVAVQEADLTSLTIAELQLRYANDDVEPLQVVDAYLSRIARSNRDLNAFVTVTRDLARRDAKNARKGQQLYGIPIAHKDLFETRGVRTTAGSLLFERYVPDTNAVIVQQFASLGAVLLGKTNTHELGGGVTTINPFFGTTRNPVDRTRIPGGSSGGSAAAVAAHLCAAATGSDTGGSIRIPAAFCGCVGFKPTHGRISTQGLIAASPTFDHAGVLTRTVEDAQILYRAVTEDADVSLTNPIRVGVPATSYFFDKPLLAPDVESAFTRAVARIGASGARIVSVALPIDDKTMSRVFDPIFLFELWGRFGSDWRTNPGSFSKEFSGVFSIERPSVTEYESALAALREYQAAVDKLFNDVDVIVTPTVPITAPPIAGPIDGMSLLKNTWPFNAAGTPAISIPIATTGLPVGLQIVGRRGEDDKLLQIARRFENR